MARILLFSGSGLFLAKKNILDIKGCRVLGQVVFNLFLPCLLFAGISKTLNVEDLLLYGVIIIFAFLLMGIGFSMGLLMARLFKPKPDFRKGVVLAMTFSNAGAIPLALGYAIAPSLPGEDAQDRVINYISIYMTCVSIAMWGIGYNYLQSNRGEESYELVEKNPNTTGDEASDIEDLTSEANQEANWRENFQKWKTQLQRFISPPVIAVFFGIVSGLITPLRHIIWKEDGPLYFLGGTIEILGQPAIPIALMILGGNMSEGPSFGHVSKRIIVSVCIARLIVLPLITLGFLEIAIKIGAISQGNKMLQFAIMLQGGTPSAINLVMMCNLQGKGEKAMSTVTFWEYIVAIPTLTMFGTLYLYLIS